MKTEIITINDKNKRRILFWKEVMRGIQERELTAKQIVHEAMEVIIDCEKGGE